MISEPGTLDKEPELRTSGSPSLGKHRQPNSPQPELKTPPGSKSSHAVDDQIRGTQASEIQERDIEVTQPEPETSVQRDSDQISIGNDLSDLLKETETTTKEMMEPSPAGAADVSSTPKIPKLGLAFASPEEQESGMVNL
jgi:hypothetical protein